MAPPEVKFTRDLTVGCRGQDVVAHKRAISRAAPNLYPWHDFTELCGKPFMAGERLLVFDQALMSFAMGNAITLEDTNGNRKLLKKRQDEKIDNVAALLDAWVAYKANKEAFE